MTLSSARLANVRPRTNLKYAQIPPKTIAVAWASAAAPSAQLVQVAGVKADALPSCREQDPDPGPTLAQILERPK